MSSGRNSFWKFVIPVSVAAGVLWCTAVAQAVTFSGTVSYTGTYSGGYVHVTVLESVPPWLPNPVATEDVAVSDPPFTATYSVDFDTTGVESQLYVLASMRDDATGTEVTGWYDTGTAPAPVSTAADRAGLDFALPRAEIRGTVTLAHDTDQLLLYMADASCNPATDDNFLLWTSDPGPYVRVLYPGTYCVEAWDEEPGFFASKLCYGDASCADPTLIPLAAGEVRTGVDLDFTTVVPVVPTTWGRIKARYRP